jgi:AAA15 family ATPase/GTPase
MLLSFRVVNHRSLRDEQQLNLAPAFDADRPPGTHWPAVPVAAVLGANASGKSNLIDALSFMRQMVLRSDREGEPGQGIARSPFLLDPNYSAADSWYDIDVVISGVRYSYGFGLNDERVVEEWLHRYPKNHKQIVFERKGNEYRFGTTIDANLKRMVDITPDRVLFISSAARFEQADVLALYKGLAEIRMSSDPVAVLFPSKEANQLFSDEQYHEQARDLLQFADLGIEDILLENVDFAEWPKFEQNMWQMTQDFQRLLREQESSDKPSRRASPPTRQELRFKMRGAREGATLSLDQQSAGTRTFLTHLPTVLTCLRQGHVMVVDELESNLHPNLARHIVGLFQDVRTNPLAAQLIITTHNTSLLGSNNEYLKRDQIWFIEKNHETGASNLYPLTDFKPRNKENTERRYLGGGYGAVPFIDPELAIEALGDKTPAAETGA